MLMENKKNHKFKRNRVYFFNGNSFQKQMLNESKVYKKNPPKKSKAKYVLSIYYIAHAIYRSNSKVS